MKNEPPDWVQAELLTMVLMMIVAALCLVFW